MKLFKTQLLTATAVGLFTATGAQALPTPYPAAEIRGNGASSVAVVITKENNCLGNATNANLGFGNNTTQDTAEHLYQPITPSLSNPIFDCGTGAHPERSVQPAITALYISTGSGAGRTNWGNFTGTAGITVGNPFSAGGWPNVQYAFSEAPLSAANLTAYDTNARGTLGDHDSNAATPDTYNKAGKPIQIPFYVVPIAVAYDPLYGKRNVAGVVKELTLNVKSTFVQKDGAGLPTGGLRMKKTTYCNIFNGVITNWNDAALKADNGGQSLMDADDDLTRWNTDGVPIRLVGRQEGSGGTSLFNRHLNAVPECDGGPFDNGIGGNSDVLPAAAKSTAVYNKTTGLLESGAEAPGKFGVANGSDGVTITIGRDPADPAVDGEVTLNGALGYLGADWVLPTTIGGTFPLLHSAALQMGATTSFKMPTAANAIPTFVGYNPPQSNLNGTYNSTAPGDRTNPTDWVLPGNAPSGLANPAKGYPIVGTANLLMYTCYNSDAKRLAMHALAALNFGKLTKDSTDAKIPAAIVTSTGKGADLYPIGILARSGLAPLPGAWKSAIWETFFQKITKAAPNNPATIGGSGLWIQDKLATTPTQIDANPVGNVVANPQCTAGFGA